MTKYTQQLCIKYVQGNISTRKIRPQSGINAVGFPETGRAAAVRKTARISISNVPPVAESVKVSPAAASPYPPAPSHHEVISICTVHIRAIATASVLLRVLEHLAKRSLVPIKFNAEYTRSRRGELLAVKLLVAAELAKVHHIVRCWEATPDVVSVLVKDVRQFI